MRHKQHSLALSFLLESLEDNSLIEAVQVAGGLIEQHERRIMQESPRKADPLPLSAGERVSELAYIGLVAVGKRHDPVVHRSFSAGFFDLFLRRVQLCDSDVSRDRVLKHLRILRHVALHVAQVGGVDLPQVYDISPGCAGSGIVHNSDPAVFHIPEAHQKLHERRFSAAALSHDPDDLILMDAQREIAEHILAPVAESDFAAVRAVEFDLLLSRDFFRLGLFFQDREHASSGGDGVLQGCAQACQR